MLIRLSNLQLIMEMTQTIWNKWKNDILGHLQKQEKWFAEKENLKEGFIVIVKQENLPLNKQALGYVLEVIPSSDKIVRILEIKTATGIIMNNALKSYIYNVLEVVRIF